jgi:hypothetical protein
VTASVEQATPAPGLTWPVKRSFVRYVARSRGRCSITDGAELLEDESFHWPLTSVRRRVDRWEARCAGDVRFHAHGGAMFVVLSTPEVHWTDEGTVDLVVHTLDEDGTPARIPLATGRLDPVSSAAPPGTWTARSLRLRSEAAPVFGGVYAAGTALADFLVHSAASPDGPT